MTSTRRLTPLLVLAVLATALPALGAAEGAAAGAAAEAGPSAEALYQDGLAAVEVGDLATALDRLERATAADPATLRYGAEYRQVAIRAEAYDRSIELFERLAAEHPGSPAVHLQWGYAHVDKIPAAGAVTGVILANKALTHFSRAIELEESWLALYTRGNSYVYWPAIFGRTQLAVDDLEKAVAISEEEGPAKPYHAHAYAALGDAWWRLEDLEAAREVWRRGLERIPGAPPLEERLALDGEALDAYLDDHYAIGNRVDTSLRELREEP